LLDVERWAELRREHFVGGVSIRELAKRTGLSRNTVRRALRQRLRGGRASSIDGAEPRAGSAA
jgi:transposase